MVDLPLWSFINVIGGVRYESTELSIFNDPEDEEKIIMKAEKILVVLLFSFIVSLKFVYAENNPATDKDSFNQASSMVYQQLEESLTELSELRKKIVDEKIPLNRKLNKLESKLIKVRRDYQKTSRLLDSHTLDLSNMHNEIKSRREEATYLSNLLSEYIRNFESRLHIAELQRYEEPLDNAKLAPEDSNLSGKEIYEKQANLIKVSLDRLNAALGGVRFEGTAVDANGLVKPGDFVLVGPAAFFRSHDGQSIGTAEQRLGSLEPTIIGFQNLTDTEAVEQVIKNSSGYLALDPTLGSAHKIESTNETLWEHVCKGGPVMLPILILAGAALIVAIYKWVFLSYQRNPSHKKIKTLLAAIARHDLEGTKKAAAEIVGPAGKMLNAGVDHIKEPSELIEEIMYEIILSTRLKLQSFLPFVAITASSAPLLGLLGTVTGIINTFKLITIFGSGDVKTLSGGISEALITTKFGLIVAIPSLLLHAFLSRKARGVIAQMEKAAVAFVNQVNRTPYKQVITLKKEEPLNSDITVNKLPDNIETNETVSAHMLTNKN